MKHAMIGLTMGAALFAVPGFAQTQMTPDDAVSAARNQLGVLEYCRDEGHIDGTAAETQTRILGMMPDATDQARVDAAYEKGKTGTVSALGVEQSLSESASAQGTDEAALCTQMAAMLAQAASQLPN